MSQPPQFKRRPPPPPPPPRPPVASVGGPPPSEDDGDDAENTTAKALNLDMSMAVLNPHAEEDDEFGIEEDEHDVMQQQQYPQGHPAAAQHLMIVPYQQQPHQPAVMSSIDEVPDYDEPKKNDGWRKYSTAAKRRDDDEGNKQGRRRSRLLGGRKEGKLADREALREQVHHVKSMPFTDQFGDFGYYTGQVDDGGRPNGKGSMKYENGVFFEGTYTAGCQDQKAAANYDRIRGGFTSWKGAGKSGIKSGMTLPWNAGRRDAYNPNEKINVRGMQWTDLSGQSGRYTGEVNAEELPHGNGIMKYDFGLIAEGEWNNGVLKEGPGDRMMAAAQAGMGGGGTVAPGMAIGAGMSVGPGAAGYASGAVSVLGAGGMSVAPGMGAGPMFGGVGHAVMMNRGGPAGAQQHAIISHQNAMMQQQQVQAQAVAFGGGGSVYGGGAGGSVVYGVPQQQQQMAMQQQQAMMPVQPQQGASGGPPSEIKLG